MKSFESDGFEEKERDLVGELNELRGRSLPENAVDQLIDEIIEGDPREPEEDLFETAIENVFRKIDAEGVEPKGFAAYDEAEALLADPGSRVARMPEEKNIAGVYDPVTNQIGLPESSSVLNWSEFYIGQLANNGYGENDAVLHHELIHSFQQSDSGTERLMGAAKDLLSFFSEGYRTRRMLRELHARIGADRSSQPHSTREHYEVLRSKYDVVADMGDIRKIITAVQQLKALYALGLDDKEIGGLVRSSKWDPEARTFDGLEGKCKEMMASRGIQKNDLEKMVVDEDVKTQIYAEKTKVAAQEEIKKLHQGIFKPDDSRA